MVPTLINAGVEISRCFQCIYCIVFSQKEGSYWILLKLPLFTQKYITNYLTLTILRLTLRSTNLIQTRTTEMADDELFFSKLNALKCFSSNSNLELEFLRAKCCVFFKDNWTPPKCCFLKITASAERLGNCWWSSIFLWGVGRPWASLLWTPLLKSLGSITT